MPVKLPSEAADANELSLSLSLSLCIEQSWNLAFSVPLGQTPPSLDHIHCIFPLYNS